jgi:hypothetical protein
MDDFSSPQHIHYSFQNMLGEYGARAAYLENLEYPEDVVIAADQNPATHRGGSMAIDTNSLNHGGEGQNVLYIGGIVMWWTTPDVGIDGDNIWCAQFGDGSANAGSPRDPESRISPDKPGDTFLVP